MKLELTLQTHHMLMLVAWRIGLTSVEKRSTPTEKAISQKELKELETQQTLLNPTSTQLDFLTEVLTAKLKSETPFKSTLDRYAEDLGKIKTIRS